MSYDFTIYGSTAVDHEAVVALVESIPGLTLGDRDRAEFTVLRGKRNRYTFTAFGPHAVEPADVPKDLSSQLPGVKASWQVIVEGSDEAAVPLARRFAKRLGVAAGGVAVDEQTGEVFGATSERTVGRAPSRPVDTLTLKWHSPVSSVRAPTVWLELAEEFLPEAVPRRFGDYEPLQYRLDRDGEAKLLEGYRDVVWFTASAPCRGGGLYSYDRYDDANIQLDTLDVMAEQMDDARWRESVRRFFVEYARSRHSVLATGEIARTEHHDRPGNLHTTAGVLGLYPYPIWWTWFGLDYVPLVIDHLPREHVTFYDGGILYVPSERPLDRRELAPLGYPIPRELHVSVDRAGNDSNSPRYGPAAVSLMPPEPPMPPIETLRAQEIAEARRSAYDWGQKPPYAGSPAAWPSHLHRIQRELAAAGVDVASVFDLYLDGDWYADAIPVIVDWLEHLDERVAAGQDREDLRYALVRNLTNDLARGDSRAIDALARQFDVSPTIDREVLKFAGWALREACGPANIEPVAGLIRRYEDDPVKLYALMNHGLPDHPGVVEIMVDCLEHLDERIPPTRPHARDYIRHTAVERLNTTYARGNRRAIDLVARVFDIEPRLSGHYLDTAARTLNRIAPKQKPQS